MSLIKLQGVVLKSINLGESDKIITIFSDKLGKIDAVARGARKPKSQFMATAQPFCYGEYMVFKGKNLYSLSQSSIIDSFQGILLDLDKLAYGSYFLELVEGLNEKENRNVSILGLLLKTLYLLIHDEPDLDLLRLIFDFKAISISGYMPQISYCVKCRDKVTENGFFNIREGGILCSNCKNSYLSYNINKVSIQFLQIIKNIKLEDLRNIKYDEGTIKYLQDIMLNYIRYHTGKDFKSLNLINQIKINKEMI